jgi:hypothetical protein
LVLGIVLNGAWPDIWQKILLKCGANLWAGLQDWWNLVEKVNAKKIEMTLIWVLAVNQLAVYAGLGELGENLKMF